MHFIEEAYLNAEMKYNAFAKPSACLPARLSTRIVVSD